MVNTKQPLPGIKDPPLEFQCRTVPAPLAKVVREPRHAAAVLGEGGLGVWQQRGTVGPGLWQASIARDSRLDQSCSDLPPLPGQVRGHLVGSDSLDETGTPTPIHCQPG
jgi:hypothetical protein